MKILYKSSLIRTLDQFNEAVLFCRDWRDQAGAIVDWTSGRLGKPGGYAGSFAMTEKDWDLEFRLFTGESITTRAGRSHIIAQETNRMLAVIEKETGIISEARLKSENILGDLIFHHERSVAAKTGMFCCGPCSIGFWRSISAGSYPSFPDVLKPGFNSLKKHRKPAGGWQRFPFYYTMLYLMESDSSEATKEIKFHVETIRRRLNLLQKKSDGYSNRRLTILQNLLSDQ